MTTPFRSLRNWAMDFLVHITPPRPTSRVGGWLHDAWEVLMILVYYLIFRFFLRLTILFLLGVLLAAECAVALPPLPGFVGAAMAIALMLFYANEFYSVEEMRKKMQHSYYEDDVEDADDEPS